MTINSRYRRILLRSTCAASLLVTSAAAYAQDAADAGADEANFGDIVVTAQRRSELARDVPISITALSGETLAAAGISDTVALSNVTPGLRMDRQGNFMVPSLRGITTTITGPGADTNVAMYLDGVYQPEPTVNTFDLPDVERVEVLKGPQGTLFGRNATAGAIQVFTKMPGDETTGNFTLSFGRFNDLQAKGFVATPLIEGKAAISVATSYRKSDTYYTNVGGGAKHPEGIDAKLIRGKLLLTPADGLKILFTGLYTDHYDSSAIIGTPLNGNSAARAMDPNAIIPTKPLQYASDATPMQRSKVYSFSGKIEAEIGQGTLTSLTSYSKFVNLSVLDADYAKQTNGGALNYAADSTNKAFSQEVTYASHSDGPFNYSAGVFYIDGWGGWTPLGLRTSSLTANIVSKQNYTSYAAFGEIYFDLTDRLSIIAGARYSHEKRDQLTAFDMTLDPDVTLTSIGKKSWNSFTPRASIKYDVTDTSNVYLSFSQGFKSGVFNTTAFSPVQADGTQPLAEPEKLYAYELGYKGRVADWLNLNAAVFYNDYKKPQQLFLVAGAGGLAQGVYGNAGGASIYGAEFDANMRFGRHFDARVGVSVLDTKYKGFENITISSPITDANGVPLNTGNVDTLYDATGNTMIKAPKFTSYLTATYHADFANGILDLTGTVFHSSASAYTFDHRIVQKAYETADVRLAWTPDTDAFTIAGYVRNLTNEDVITGTYAQVAGDGISYAPPRTWGIQLDLRF